MNPTMSPIDWAKRPFQKYADFGGRAPRAEYWWFVLFVFIGEIIAMLLDSIVGTGGIVGNYGIFVLLFVLAVIIPHIAVGIRRLHDTDHSGWWLLIAFIPLVGAIVLLVFFVTSGDSGDNRFGPNPYSADVGEVFA